MYLSITLTGEHAPGLNHLLHKHPDRVHRRERNGSTVTVFTPVFEPERVTVGLLVEVDPIDLVRGRGVARDSFTLGQYVNDRPYAANSLLAVALRQVFSTAIAGNSTARADIVAVPLPLRVEIPALPGGELIRELFEPLGWRVTEVIEPLDPEIPAWGDAPARRVVLEQETVLSRALSQLYVLLPVLDGAKHYWVDQSEAQTLLRHGGDWLAGHPLRELILRRALIHQGEYVAEANAGLDAGAAPAEPETSTPTPRVSLARERRDGILERLRELPVSTVVDMGCGQGALLSVLLRDARFTRVIGADVSPSVLAQAERALGLDRMPESQRARLELVQSSLTYRDDRLAGADAMVLMEVIEHLDPERLPRLEHAVFTHARPAHVLVSTPNAEYNVHYPGLSAGGFRHPDHRFEWTRREFAAWADRVAATHGYHVSYSGLGPEDAETGAPTQLATFIRGAA
ncbi:3' terminal RNA ribose 2'-O-methyltransferase Hen1 [Mycetocola tolaasinivorans]|uniref:Small RNA 2'-O-methyltransferase n=1 Tax=Mycetocola tolaasinivorans TaxID=76635 RepID=A0A3L7A907_9MICO|nr:3' terminal RNA ribose 2'-O-methyltransferase Hen1 [Mycetocola tolaasinivorans]RLP76071.1 3' terminal RNA ribose 2'-O-methyltransferase Hen1 [Mycetocola tolaasinivorans]